MRLCFLDYKGIDLSILHFIYSDCIRQGEQSLQIVVKVKKIEKDLMKKLETIETTLRVFSIVLFCFVFWNKENQFSFQILESQENIKSDKTRENTWYCIFNYMSYFISMYNFDVKLQMYKRRRLIFTLGHNQNKANSTSSDKPWLLQIFPFSL